LIYLTRFGELAAVVAAVFGGSIVVELLRQLVGTASAPSGSSRRPCNARLRSRARAIAPVLLIFTFLVPVIFYDQRPTFSISASWCLTLCDAGMGD